MLKVIRITDEKTKYKILEIHTIGYHRDEFIDISDEERKIGE